MVDPSWNSREFRNLYGAQSKPKQRDVSLPNAVIADNCDFFSLSGDESRGAVSTRLGFGSTGISTTVAHTALYDWITSLGHYVVYWSASGAIAQLVGGSATSLALTNTATGISHAQGGARLFAALFDSSGYGVAQGRCITKNAAGTIVMDTLFPPPIAYAPGAPTEPGAGQVTAGLHRLGYIIEYRSGFLGRLQPDVGSGSPGVTDTFVPVAFTSAGSKNLSWTLNTTWPAGAIKVHVAMAAVENPNVFILVPGANAVVVGTQASSVTIVFDINDGDLLANLGDADATEHRLLYTQAVAGTGPFFPSAVCEYNNRMVYVTRIADSQTNLESAVFASEQTKYQHITLSQHLINAAGAADLRTAFVLQKRLFVAGPNKMYATRDNGLSPAEWPPLSEVNGARGTECVNGIAVNPDEGYAWIPNRAGLFYFDGARFAHRPMSEGVAEWDQIYWPRAAEIKTLDDPANQRVIVAVPLAATGGLTLLVFYYQRGKEPQEIDFTKWTIGSSFVIGTIALVVGDWSATSSSDKKRLELTLISGAATARKILRQTTVNDATPWRDYQTDSTNAAIALNLRLAPFTDGRSTLVIRHEAAAFDISGVGTVQFRAHALDSARTYTLNSIALQTAPGQSILRGIDKTEDGLMLDFVLNALDAHVTISGLKYYWQKGAAFR